MSSLQDIPSLNLGTKNTSQGIKNESGFERFTMSSMKPTSIDESFTKSLNAFLNDNNDSSPKIKDPVISVKHKKIKSPPPQLKKATNPFQSTDSLLNATSLFTKTESWNDPVQKDGKKGGKLQKSQSEESLTRYR